MTKITISIILILLTAIAESQDIKYFDKTGKETTVGKAVRIESTVRLADNHFLLVKQKKNRDTISLVTCSTLSPMTRDGITKIYYDSGTLHYLKNYRDNKLEGETVRYYENGEIQSTFKLVSDSVIYERSYDLDGNEVANMPYFTPAKFRNGDIFNFRMYVYRNIRYPQVTEGPSLSEECPVTFLVDKEGHIRNIETEAHIVLFKEEITRLLNNTEGQWTPGTKFGEPADINYRFKITFGTTP